jgi:glycosyltransferase involved in cell wall biosynthesis
LFVEEVTLMIIMDVTQTCGTRANTGIQRVVRAVFRTLKDQCEVMPVRFDTVNQRWYRVEGWFMENLEVGGHNKPSQRRGAGGWLTRRLQALRYQGTTVSQLDISSAGGILLPEPFSSEIYKNLSYLRQDVRGPCIAIFHDAIPLKLPRFSSAKVLARMPEYMHELASMDAVLANSCTSRHDLIGFWTWATNGKPTYPDVGVLTFGVDLPHLFSDSAAPCDDAIESAVPEILCVGTLEGRKNHLELLAAAEMLWLEKKSFRLRLIGMVQRETGVAVLAKIRELQTKGYPLQWNGPVSDEELARAYRRCSFTVYPSLMEGFGIPVIESLAFGKPCVCSNEGALGELVNRFGGIGLSDVRAHSLHRAIVDLLGRTESGHFLPSLGVIPSWDDCARDVALFFERISNSKKAEKLLA